MSQKNKLHLPIVEHIKVANMSLYTAKSSINATFDRNVFCLVGANGLGKSTFLTTLNYSLTGIVPDPERPFKSVEEFYSYNRGFSDDYYDGRVDEIDRELADVSAVFRIGNYRYKITRPIFSNNELSEFEIFDVNKGEVILNSEGMSPVERNSRYINQITKHIGLESFSQFVFIQHLMLTFDENRNLLFWNETILEQALYLAFGLNYLDAQQADSLRREVEKADSLARNANWQASSVKRRLSEILNVSQEQEINIDEDIIDDYKRKYSELQEIEIGIESIYDNVKDWNLRLSQSSIDLSIAQSNYNNTFNNHMNTNSDYKYHPLITQTIQEEKCGICGTSGEYITRKLSELLERDVCPLCGTVHSDIDLEDGFISNLKDIDDSISKFKLEVSNATSALIRLKKDLELLEGRKESKNSEIRAIENSYKNITLVRGKQEDSLSDLSPVVKNFEKQIEDFEKQKKKHIERRDKSKRELISKQKSLELQYLKAEEHFVPMFKKLALEFLGIDLDVSMQTSSRKLGVKLTLEVRSKARRSAHQLSESQRFFVDIALRMAFAEYMSNKNRSATLYIDTPEGSLDIAYENRAGSMFAKFASVNNRIVMTANVNSSRLLLNLAQKCGNETMKIIRMTDWTDLSEVQIEEEGLFEEAFNNIKVALNKGVIV